MSTQVTTPKFRVSFPWVFKPRKNDLSGKDEYSVVALFPKGADLTAMKAAANEALVKKFGADKSKWPSNLRSPFRDQKERMKDGKMPDGHEEGAIFINLKSTDRPTVVDQNLQAIIEPSKFYAGCYARASVNAYAYDNKGNRGVSFGLNHLQLMADGEALSGTRVRVEDAFEAVGGLEESASSSDLFG